MIPLAVVPLKGITVLVTRPADQANGLCERIDALGGESLPFPTIAIEAIENPPLAQAYDWLIFISANAVRHGLAQIKRGAHSRIAAVGKATAAALAANNIRVDAMPAGRSTSEELLAHPSLANVAKQRVLIVKGVGGRELLHDALLQRGAEVATLDVYRRIPPRVDAALVNALEQRWRDQRIDLVTLTSVETLDNLLTTLTDAGRALLMATAFVTSSERIAAAARTRGLIGQCVLSRNADDEAMVGAIAAWHARAR